jgi:hypothetical protein
MTGLVGLFLACIPPFAIPLGVVSVVGSLVKGRSPVLGVAALAVTGIWAAFVLTANWSPS